MYIVLNSCFPMFSMPLIRLLLLVAVSIGIAPLLMFEKHASDDVPALNMNVAMHNFFGPDSTAVAAWVLHHATVNARIQTIHLSPPSHPTSPPSRSTQWIVGGCCDDCAAHCAGRCTGHWPRCDCWILSKWCCCHWSRFGPWPFCLLPGLCCSIPCL